MATAGGQKLKLKWSMESFRRNLDRMKGETEEEANKTLLTGASAYATSASKHSPPNLGKPEIDPTFYIDGRWVRNAQEERSKIQGVRKVIDLVSMARDPEAKGRALYGKLARQGYKYMVIIARNGRAKKQILCKTEAEAGRFAHESYRGLTRAAWGLSLQNVTGKVPTSFRKYLSRRPELSRLANLNSVTMDKASHTVTITNFAIPAGAPYLSSTDVNASIAAVRSMDDRMEKFFRKKYAL